MPAQLAPALADVHLGTAGIGHQHVRVILREAEAVRVGHAGQRAFGRGPKVHRRDIAVEAHAAGVVAADGNPAVIVADGDAVRHRESVAQQYFVTLEADAFARRADDVVRDIVRVIVADQQAVQPGLDLIAGDRPR
jgi:hypothetical protein